MVYKYNKTYLYTSGNGRRPPSTFPPARVASARKKVFRSSGRNMVMKAKERKTRHRAELREEILAAARTLIQKHGDEGLTMRRLAQQTGYTPMALYSYFADKQAILAALAQEGFERLAEKLGPGGPLTDPLTTLRQMLRACVAHGIANPAEYRIVFMTPEAGSGPVKSPSELARENAAFRILLQRVEACVEAGALPGAAFATSALLWAGVHGATALLITFPRFPFGEPMAYAELVVDRLLAGLQARGAAALRPPSAKAKGGRRLPSPAVARNVRPKTSRRRAQAREQTARPRAVRP